MGTSSRRLSAIMFTDMVGFSALVQDDEANALALLDDHNRILRQVFSEFRGREIKTVGDAFLVEFSSALEATRCALGIQQRLHEHNESAPANRRIRIRIGLHVGDVVRTDGDLLGDAVNIASRIEHVADRDGICVSQQVYDQVQNKIETPFARLPPVTLKNIRFPIAVYRVVPPWEKQSAVQLASDTLGGSTLAVLPLANISPDPNDEYFADGLTEELISAMSHLPGLNVIARTSVVPYKSAPKPVAQVGLELGADKVLEGSVRKAGNRIRISLQLIDAVTQRHLWAETYNREIGDVFAVQTEIADRTAQALRPALAIEELPEPQRKPTANSAAYDAYLRGLVASKLGNLRGLQEAVRCYEQATKLDPDWAEPYAAWGNLFISAAGSYISFREVMTQARELAARALKLDPNSSEAHAALGNIAMQCDHDWRIAETEFLRAIELNPNNAVALDFLGLLYMALERFDEAKDVLRRAILIDPRGSHQRVLCWAELESGNFDEAIWVGEEERDLHPSSVQAHTFLGLYYFTVGRREDALREADFPVTGATEVERFDQGLLNALVGRPDAARQILAEEERGESKSYNSATDLAMLYAAIGDKEKALELLEKDSRDGDQVLWLFYRGAYFDSIRDDPRFIAMLRQFQLPTRGIHRFGRLRP